MYNAGTLPDFIFDYEHIADDKYQMPHIAAGHFT